MNTLERSRLLRVMKITTNAFLIMLVTGFVLSLLSKKALFIASGNPLYIMDEYEVISFKFKIIFNFLVTGKIALYVFIVYKIRKVFNNLTMYHPFEKDNIRCVRLIGKSIALLVIFPFVYYFAINSNFPIHGAGNYLMVLIYKSIPSLFISITILVVAEVFRRGAEMYTEQKLTV